MQKRTAKKKEKIFVLNISLCDKPQIRREIAIGESQTLYTLAEAIVDSYDFALDHCFGFYDNYGKGIKPQKVYVLFKDIGEDCDPNARGVKKTTVAEAFKLAKKLKFLFDYGDCWLFDVELTGTGASGQNRKYPLLISKTDRSPEQYPEVAE